MKALGILFYALFALALSSIANSFVVYKLWQWIISPVFSVSYISFAAPFGLVVFVKYLTGQKASGSDKKYSKEQITDALGDSIGKALFFLALGYLASLFI